MQAKKVVNYAESDDDEDDAFQPAVVATTRRRRKQAVVQNDDSDEDAFVSNLDGAVEEEDDGRLYSVHPAYI